MRVEVGIGVWWTEGSVTLDGMELKNCIIADEEKGYCEVFYKPTFWDVDNYEYPRKIVKGRVELKYKGCSLSTKLFDL